MTNISGRTQRLENIGAAAAGIAHDINNQLTLIVNHLDMGQIEPAKNAANRCTALTASLLSFCKGESLEIGTLDVSAFLEQYVCELWLPESIELELRIPRALPPVHADPTALKRALDNLVGNARQAMRDHGVLTISASAGLISVSDSGPGIPPEVRDRIFHPFFTTRGEAGAGLGLAIVREIMRQHGGAIEIGCEPGEGTRCVLSFRRADVA